MELKLEFEEVKKQLNWGFNRTFMELKLYFECSFNLHRPVLIGPSWN